MKKLLSVLIAIMIIVSILPATLASDTVPEKIEYVFNRGAYKDANGGQNSSTLNDAAVTAKTHEDMYNGYSAWNVEGFSYAYLAKVMASSLFWNSATNRVSGETQANLSLAAAIALDVTGTGTFIPELKYLPKTSAPAYNVYFVKKAASDNVADQNENAENGWRSNATNFELDAYLKKNASDGKFIGRVDMYGDGENGTATFSPVNITEPGDYYLLFVDDGVNEKWKASGTSAKRADTYITSFTLTPAETQEDVISAFALDGNVATAHSASIKPLAAALDGNTITAEVSAADADGDGVYTVTAPATDESGEYTFLYWIKGLTQDKANKIVSLSPTIEEYKPQNEANYLIAVYEKKNAEAEAKAEFYDGNGQLLYTTAEDGVEGNDVTVEDGVITMPSLPQMANYADATHWQLYGDSSNTKYGADVATAELSGNMIFVAQYDDVYFMVGNEKVRYGDSITFEADPDTEKYFKWWTRTVDGVTEIVSLDREYTFFPWEDCTVEAVYGDEKQIMAGNLRKIVIDTLGNNAVMAEFIGLDGAEVVEKGIILTNSEETKKIAMSTNASQFTITNDILATTAKGYAIIKDGEVFKEITDGTATLNQ